MVALLAGNAFFVGGWKSIPAATQRYEDNMESCFKNLLINYPPPCLAAADGPFRKYETQFKRDSVAQLALLLYGGGRKCVGTWYAQDFFWDFRNFSWFTSFRRNQILRCVFFQPVGWMVRSEETFVWSNLDSVQVFCFFQAWRERFIRPKSGNVSRFSSPSHVSFALARRRRTPDAKMSLLREQNSAIFQPNLCETCRNSW